MWWLYFATQRVSSLAIPYSWQPSGISRLPPMRVSITDGTAISSARMSETQATHADNGTLLAADTARIVGRNLELDRLRAFVDSARSVGGVLLLTGEPGVGKTRL